MPHEKILEKAAPRVPSIPVLDLFAGYGGATLAFDAAGGFHTIGFSEISAYPSAILAHRWPGIPNLGMVQSVTADEVVRRCGQLPAVVTGGFPCQPHSVAGSRLAGADERDLWDECCRVLRDLRPRAALFENVPGLLSSEGYSDAADGRLVPGLFFNRILSDLAEIRYACLWTVLSAAELGASHGRDRVWLLCLDELADPADLGWRRTILAPGTWDQERRGYLQEPGQRRGGRGDVADTDRLGGEQDSEPGQLRAEGSEQPSGYRWPAGPPEGPEESRWPARDGRWPAKPGHEQFPWEPPRSIASAQPQVGGGADGAAARTHAAAEEVQEAPDQINPVHRIHALGNGIVPWVAFPFAVAIRRLLTRGVIYA